MAVNKIDPKVIFASEAPAQDTPAVFTNRTVGWGETRKNGGRPTIKQMNAEQQSTDLKILWLNENAVTPFDSTIDYPTNAVTIKDGIFKIFDGSVWEVFLDKTDIGLGNVDNTSDLNKSISTATQTALDLKADKSYVDNSLPHNNLIDRNYSGAHETAAIVNNSGETQQQINDRGGATWYAKAGGYALSARVILDNGDIVKSTVPNNTANPNVDMTGWVSENLEDYIVFLEFFGASGGDAAKDTAAFYNAVNSGATIRLKSGKNYVVNTNRQTLGSGKSVKVIAEKDATITLKRGAYDEIFDATNADKIEFDGVNFLVDAGGSTTVILRLCHYDAESYVNKVSIINCSSVGNFSINRVSGSQTRDPILNPFGFKEVYVNNNNFSETRGFVFSATDFPIYYSEFKNNTVRNFSNVAFHILTTNTAANNWKIGRVNTTFVHDNIVKNDDSFWNEDSAGNYHCFLLFEGMHCSYQRNHVEGLKSKKANIELYDAYMNTRKLIHSGNTYKNNGNFTAGANEYNWLIQSKTESKDPSGTLNDIATTKIITNNTYVIEPDWIERVGGTVTSLTHKLTNLAIYNCGHVVMTGNTFSLDKLSYYKRDPYESLTFNNNTIACNDLLLGTLFAFTAYDANSTLSMNNNHVTIKNPTGSITYLFGDRSSTDGVGRQAWKSLEMSGNSLTVINANQETNSRVFRQVEAEVANIVNNNFLFNMITDYSFCTFNRIRCINNTFRQLTKTVQLQPMYAITSRGQSSIEGDYFCPINSPRFKVFVDSTKFPESASTYYLVKLRVFARDGEKEISFKYRLDYAIETGYKVVFFDSTGVEKTISPLTSSENGITIQVITSGSSALSLTARFFNSSTETSFGVSNTPGYSCRYTISVEAVE